MNVPVWATRAGERLAVRAVNKVSKKGVAKLMTEVALSLESVVWVCSCVYSRG